MAKKKVTKKQQTPQERTQERADRFHYGPKDRPIVNIVKETSHANDEQSNSEEESKAEEESGEG